jgi:DNA-binding NarL/FixJ family response regulator
VANGGPVALTLARLELAAGHSAADSLAVAERTAAATAWSPHVRLVQATAATNPEDALRHARAARREAERYGLSALVEAADKLVAAVSGRSGPGLTPRERDVARLAVQGLSIKDIATRLVIGERTVETHLASIYRKLGVRSRADLMARFATLSTMDTVD